MRLTLPIYYTITYKTKADKTILVGMNWFRNAHFSRQNEVKKFLHACVIQQLQEQPSEPFNNVSTQAFLYYKNPISDADNIVSFISKAVVDTLQNQHIIKNDNVQFYRKAEWEVVGQDRENPRLEFDITTWNN